MEKPKWAQNQTVVRESDVIIIYDLHHPRVASDFIKELKDGIQKGYDDFELEFEKVNSVFPNACVPLAGILDYYREFEKISFTCQAPPPNIVLTNLLKAKQVKYSANALRRTVLNKVWRFSIDEEIFQLVNAILDELYKSAHFEKGVLDALEWSLNEIMDNVLQHSNCDCGYCMGQIHNSSKHVAFTVYDHGRGFLNSLRESKYSPRYPIDAITLAVREGVTRNKEIGQGNGLYGLHQIVSQNNGILTITSAGSSCNFSGDDTKTYSRLPFLSKEHGAACIDFQLDYNNPVSISDALSSSGRSYNVISIKRESVENEMGDIYYKISNQASGTGTRQSAERLRNDILNLYTEAPKQIIIDFEGITIMSSSFADELIGKLVIEFGFFEFNRLVRIINMNDTISVIAQKSIYQRITESTK